MDTKVKEVTQAVLESLSDAKGMDQFIDSSDAQSTAEGDTATFSMTKWHDRPGTGRGAPAQPLGKFVYTVTVTAKYVPFED